MRASRFSTEIYEVDIAFLRREAEQGDEDAAYVLYIATGSAEGARWICLAAHSGNKAAQNEFARFQWYGYPPYQEDKIVGYLWHNLAAANGYYGGDEIVSERAALLTSDELSQAKLLIEDWKPDPTECELVSSVGQ